MKTNNSYREKTICWNLPSISLKDIQSMSGLEALQAVKNGKIAPPPLIDVLGIKLVEVEIGRVVFALEPEEYHFNWAGSIIGGAICTVLDAAMTHAVHSVLPVGAGYTTLEMKTNFVRAIKAEDGALNCEGRTIHTGRSIGTAEGRVIDSEGKIFAHGSATCMIFRS